MIKTLCQRILKVIFHLLAITLLIFSLVPIFQWYFGLRTIPGSDYYNTGSYLQKLIQDSQFPPKKWLYHWFLGHPLTFDYHYLHLYTMLPLVQKFGIIQAQNFYALGSLMILIVFTYLLFEELSKTKVLSLILALAVAYSFAIYASLIVVGSVTFLATQAFLPLSLYFLEKHRRKKKTHFFYLSVLSTGLSTYGHTSVSLVYVLPLTLIVIFFTHQERKIQKTLLYLFLSLLVGSPATLPYIINIASKLIPTQEGGRWFDPNYFPGKGSFFKDFLGTNPSLIFSLLLLVFGLFIKKRRRKKEIISHPYLMASLYLVVLNLLVYFGFKDISGWLFWPRSLWAFPVILGALSASLYSRLKSLLKFYHQAIFWLVLLAAFIFGRGIFLEKIKASAGGGYAYPGIVTQNLSQEELNHLKEKLAPAWLETASKQERLYSLDDRFNMWWSAFFDLAQVRGYFPGLLAPQQAFFFNQADISLMDNTMEKKLNISKERAQNTSLFYLDWYAIRYLALTGRFKLSSYLDTNSVIRQRENLSGINYLELNHHLFSPILTPTNSPTLCVLGSSTAYNYLMRGLSRFNLNSKILIPLKGPKFVEDLEKSFLESCDAFLLADFRTRLLSPKIILRNQKWKALGQAIYSGRPVFIETGEAKSAGVKGWSLPEFFPVSQTQLEPLGKNWQFKTHQNSLLKNVKTDLFSPPVWEDYPWKLSFSRPEDVKSWGEIVLENSGHPVLVRGTYGQGKVIWSGLNLPFHLDYYDNEEEAKLFLNIINEILRETKSEKEKAVILFDFDWVSPEKRIVTAETKGILFKENWNPGWQATTDNQRLKILKAGPNWPGFMYVRLSDQPTNQAVVFHYSGPPQAWFYHLINLITLAILIEEIIFGDKGLFKKSQGKLKMIFQKKLSLVKTWWNKE